MYSRVQSLPQHQWQVLWLPSVHALVPKNVDHLHGNKTLWLPSVHALVPKNMDHLHGNKTPWLPYLLCLHALPINPVDSLTMLNKNYKTHISWPFFKVVFLNVLHYDFHQQNHEAASWARPYCVIVQYFINEVSIILIRYLLFWTRNATAR